MPATAAWADGGSFEPPHVPKDPSGTISVAAHAAADPEAFFLGLDNMTYRQSDLSSINNYDAACNYARFGVFGTDFNQNPDNLVWNQFYNFWAEKNGATPSQEFPQAAGGGGPNSEDTTGTTVSLRPDILLGISSSSLANSYSAQIAALPENTDDDPNNDYVPILIPYTYSTIHTVFDSMHMLANAADTVAANTGKTTRYNGGNTLKSVEDFESIVLDTQYYILKQIDADVTTRKTVAFVSSANSDTKTFTLTQFLPDAMEIDNSHPGRIAAALQNCSDDLLAVLNKTDKIVTPAELMLADYVVFTGTGSSVVSPGGVPTVITDILLDASISQGDIDNLKIFTGLPAATGVFGSNGPENAQYVPAVLGFVYNDVIDQMDLMAWYYYNIYHVKADAVQNMINVNCTNLTAADGSLAAHANYNTDITNKFAEGKAYYNAHEQVIINRYPNLISYEGWKAKYTTALTAATATISTTVAAAPKDDGGYDYVAPTVSVGGKNLSATNDYLITYKDSAGRTRYAINEPGEYTATITGIAGSSQDQAGYGGYSGSFTVLISVVEEPAVNPQTIVELSGAARIDTAILTAKEAFPSGANTAIVAYSQNFPDALTVTTVAGLKAAPILLNDTASLSPAVKQALIDLNVKDIIIVGGTSVLSNNVQDELETALGGASHVTRLSGADRFATNLAIYDYVKTNGGIKNSTVAIVASGNTYPDALSVSPFAVSGVNPLFLTNNGELNDAAKTALSAGGFRSVVVVGGTAAVSATTQTWLENSFGASAVKRLGGDDRYETSQRIAKWLIDEASVGYTWDASSIATGTDFPDALAGSVLAARVKAPILLVKEGSSIAIDEMIANKATVTKIHYLGGTSAVSQTIRSYVSAGLGWS
jgi:putative cell wall-binding protein